MRSAAPVLRAAYARDRDGTRAVIDAGSKALSSDTLGLTAFGGGFTWGAVLIKW